MEKREGMVAAIHPEFGENWFSEISWELMSCNRGGWIRFDELTDAEEIPTNEIKINDIQLKEKDAEIKKLKALLLEKESVNTGDEITVDEMKTFLKDKDVKFHHKTGDEKIKILYNENRE